MINPPVKLALYGCGNRTRALLDAVALDGPFEVVAAYDLNPAAVDAMVERFGGVACTSSEELISAPQAEAFLISLDPFAHPAAFDECLPAGKPIFLEKPIAMTAAEAHRMMLAAETANVPVQVGFMRRYRPQHLAALEYLQSHDPGAMLGLACRWFHAGETEQINMLNNFPDNFRLKVSQIPFHCCHALDVMMRYGGKVTRVSAVGTKVVDRPYPSPDEVIATLQFESGAVGTFHYSSIAFQGGINYVLHAENYSLDMTGNTLSISKRPPLRSLRENEAKDCRPWYLQNVAPETRQFSSMHVDHLIMLDFLRAVRSGEPMTAPIRDGYLVAELAEAIERSWQEDHALELPLSYDNKKETP